MDMEAEQSSDDEVSADEEDAEEAYESDFVDDEIQSQPRSLSVGMDLYYSVYPSCPIG